MTKIYFVRHAQPEYGWEDDRTRPLTDEGRYDAEHVTAYLQDKRIDMFYSSPYVRSIETIAGAARYFNKEIVTDERLRERRCGFGGNSQNMFQARWTDKEFHEEDGESINMVQERNLEALKDILGKNHSKNLVVGTHGTALSSILSYYDMSFGVDSFLRIIDWMPYMVEFNFEENQLLNIVERLHVHKKYK